jgi:Zn-dependent protease
MDGWWVAREWEESPVSLVSWVVWVIGSIVLHELAHGWAAIRAGDRTPIDSGHMTWNPLVHMGQTSLIMFALVGIAWGAMPVDPSRFRGRYDDAKVAFAGPAMNLVLFGIAILAAVGAFIFEPRLGDPLGHNVFVFCITGAYLNLALMFLNLLPVPPLDGSRILGSFVPGFNRFWTGEQAPIIGLVAFIAVFFFGGRYVFGAAQYVTLQTFAALLKAFGQIGTPDV